MKTKREWVLKAALGLMLPIVWTTGIGIADAGQPRAASSTVTRTGPAGNTATRQQSSAYNPATHTYNRTSTTTGPNGRTATSVGQATYNPATGAVNQSRTSTGPNGRSATETRTATPAAPPSGG